MSTDLTFITIETFDFVIGLTATPGKQATGFFNKNLVSEHPYERGVANGVNVAYEFHRIKTQVTKQGRTIEKGASGATAATRIGSAIGIQTFRKWSREICVG